MKLLTGDAIAREITKLVRKRGKVRAAVAFWGADAAADTGLESKDKGQILCDLFSGGCNPYEVKKLMGYGLDVKTLHGMHAKIWINGDSVILGSANASANGLGFEQKAMDVALRNIPNTEVNVLIRDRNFSEAATDWFDRQWDHSKPVTKLKLKEAELLWKRRKRRGAGRVSDISILTAVNESRLLRHFSKLRVAAYTNGVSKEAEQIFEERKRGYPTACNLGFYEWDKAMTRGTVYIDFVFSPRGETKSKYGGMWKVLETVQQSTGEGYRVVVADQVFDFRGYRFPKGEQAEVEKRLDAWLEDNERERKDGLDLKFIEFWKKTTST